VSAHDLPELLIEPIVRRALEEDLGRAGDITTKAVVPAGARARAMIRARHGGTIAGLQAAQLAFRLIDPALVFETGKQDGAWVSSGDVIATVTGAARGLLSAERVALNFLGHLCGIATETSRLVEAVHGAGPGVKTRVTCTRKTTPGLRILEKQAVLLGGGFNHRFGLDDAMLIKDNHIAAAGSVSAALEAAKRAAGHMVQIEIEIETQDQLLEALAHGAQVILLDNMTPEELAEAVRLTAGRAVLEASGSITLESAAAIARTGVDYISSGALTHSAPALDVGLDFDTTLRA
jgi:nicotinate-nucleotide pyrophosphorylase (carboxylating)